MFQYIFDMFDYSRVLTKTLLNCIFIINIAFSWTQKRDQYLYDPALLALLDFDRSPATFKPKISAVDPGSPWMVVRPLKESDYDRGFLHLLGQLTSVGDISRGEFLSE